MVGCDKYNAVDGKPNLSSIASTFYSLVKSTEGEKMVAMTENDSIPSLDNLINDKAAWLYFCPWYQNYLTSEDINPVESLSEIYNSDYCITLDELPDLRSYPLDSEPQTDTSAPSSETTTASEEESTTGLKPNLLGDANCDEKVNIADAVFIMQAVTNPDKYGEGRPNGITPQGVANGDVDKTKKGLDSNDALKIQKFKLGLIPSLS